MHLVEQLNAIFNCIAKSFSRFSTCLAMYSQLTRSDVHWIKYSTIMYWSLIRALLCVTCRIYRCSIFISGSKQQFCCRWFLLYAQQKVEMESVWMSIYSVSFYYVEHCFRLDRCYGMLCLCCFCCWCCCSSGSNFCCYTFRIPLNSMLIIKLDVHTHTYYTTLWVSQSIFMGLKNLRVNCMSTPAWIRTRT